MLSTIAPVRVLRALAAAAVLLVSLAPTPARAQAPLAPAPVAGADEAPGARLTVFLLTMGQGDQVWEKFGHNAIWIHDEAEGTDRVYNYGLFDFHSPGYWSRFIQGTWIYQMGVDDIDRTLFQYRYFDREVVAQRLNLAPAQKAELQRFLEWNALPENREYLYDYFRDNCSTRVRDALDRVLGGALHQATAEVPTGTTYRWHSERLIADDEAAYTGLLAGLGPAADRPIDAWEEMFLPFAVQEQVRRLQVPTAEGGMAPLVAEEIVLVRAEGRPGPLAEPPLRLHWYLLAGVGLAGALLALGRKAPASRAARFGFSALSAIWLLLAGTGGVILLGLWAFTDHEIAYRNENLLQLSPLALPLVLLVPALAYGARWAARLAWWLSAAVTASSLLGLVIQPLPGLDQVNAGILAVALPANLALAWVVRGLEERVRGGAPTPSAPRRAGRRAVTTG